MEIIKADLSKLDELSEFSAQFFDEIWSTSSFESEIKKPNSAVFCAVNDNDEICGVACIENQYGDGYLHNIAVNTALRKQGIGKILTDKCADFIKSNGVNKIFLEVRVSNIPAIKLYEKIGFKIVATRKGFYSNPTEDAYSMILELD